VSSKRRSVKLSIAIPASLVSEVSHLREKTSVIGQIGRAAAIFRVEDIYIYPDAPDESHLIRLILSYMETPQYLRRRMFSKRTELRYVGVLPPLRTPHHPLESQAAKLRRGEFREGVVLAEDEGEFIVDVGVDRPLRATGRAPSIGGRATVEVTETQPELKGRFVGRGEVDCYWGYGIHISGRSLGRLALSNEFDLTMATSRQGPPYPNVEDQMRRRWSEARSVLVAFGSPRSGLREILTSEELTMEEVFHFNVNTIPQQGCETVRTEEAVYATLAILNLLGP
jgi:predicted SPOUT superfamily RNA methylase MTH1